MNPEHEQLVRWLAAAQQIIFFALMTVCAYTDIAGNKVYNRATLPALAAGLAIWFIPFGPGRPFLYSLAAMALGGGIFFLFFLFKAVGGGDVKLMAAVGALMGLHFAVNALVVIALVGAVMALAAMLWRGRLREGLGNSAKMLLAFRRSRPTDGQKPLTIPYGVAIAVGSIITWSLLMFSGHLQTVATAMTKDAF